MKTFKNAVKCYERLLKGKIENKVLFCVLDIRDKDAFFSIAPLSRAVHNLGGDMQVQAVDGKSDGLEVMKDIWKLYDGYCKGLKNEKIRALLDFVKAVDKRTKTKKFLTMFKKPEIMITAAKDHFRGTMALPFEHSWHKSYRWNELMQTAARIWKEGYALRKNDIVGIGGLLVPSEKNTELPLKDYLDSFAIGYAMILAAKRFKTEVGFSASSDRFSMLAEPVRTAELITTIRGCELDKNVNEEVFRKFRKFSELLDIGRMRFSTAGFGIHAKGYYGKHFFGETIGYPSLNRKTRWTSPGQMMLKDMYSPQSKFETRDPMMRYAITESLPIGIFIKTCNVEYKKLRKRSEKIKNIFNRCQYIRVIGNKMHGYKTDFTVGLIDKGKRNEFTAKDSDVTTVVDMEAYRKTGKKYGNFANFPSGETFTTPASMKGAMIGDVVINIDRSYRIPKENPIILRFDEKGYKVVKGPANFLNKMKSEKKDAMKKIKDYERSKSLPKEIIDIYKRNFEKVGEFAVNTNPKAKVCDYLIVNEKIARMIHVALGSGFLANRKTLYHWDIVVNSPKQKLDIFGVDKNKKEHWVIKKGRFVV